MSANMGYLSCAVLYLVTYSKMDIRDGGLQGVFRARHSPNPQVILLGHGRGTGEKNSCTAFSSPTQHLSLTWFFQFWGQSGNFFGVEQEDLMSFFTPLIVFLLLHFLHQCQYFPAVQCDQYVMCLHSCCNNCSWSVKLLFFSGKYCFADVQAALRFSQKQLFVKGSQAGDGRR